MRIHGRLGSTGTLYATKDPQSAGSYPPDHVAASQPTRLTDRGVLRVGACADIAIFDPATFADQGTTFEPNQTALGMHHVIVNGKAVLKNGIDRGT